MGKRKYIVAHNRDRDFYQVAGALAEADLLSCLVTDYYSDGSGRGFDRRLGHRKSDLVPAELTQGILSSLVLQGLKKPLDSLGLDTIHQVNRLIGRRSRALARSLPDTDLFLYSTYAAEAFADPALAERSKNLFMFHPHPTLIREILEPDVLRSGVGQSGLMEEAGSQHRTRVLDIELAHADRVMCASALTKRSIIRAGVDPERIHVVPYGIARPMPDYRNLRKPESLRFLFVGQAIHRKGLHHLLSAWRRTRPVGAKLTLVCSRAQDGILDNLPEGVVVKSGLTKEELWVEYCSAHCCILPALIEGFGLVLLEAISAGCYVIFSENTGFADLGIPDSAGLQIRAGCQESISEALTAVMERASKGMLDAESVRAVSALFSPERFRKGIREGLGY